MAAQVGLTMAESFTTVTTTLEYGGFCIRTSCNDGRVIDSNNLHRIAVADLPIKLTAIINKDSF